MAGYRYRLLVNGQEIGYWSAYRLRPGTRIVLRQRALVVESVEPEDGDAEIVARCRAEAELFGASGRA